MRTRQTVPKLTTAFSALFFDMIVNVKNFKKNILRYSQGLILTPFSRDLFINKLVDENGRKANLLFCVINEGESVKDFFEGFEGLNLFIFNGYNAIFYRNPTEQNITLEITTSTDVINANISQVVKQNDTFILDKKSKIFIDKQKNVVSNFAKTRIVNLPYGKTEIDVYDSISNFQFVFDFTEHYSQFISSFRETSEGAQWYKDEQKIINPFKYALDDTKIALDLKINFHNEENFYLTNGVSSYQYTEKRISRYYYEDVENPEVEESEMSGNTKTNNFYLCLIDGNLDEYENFALNNLAANSATSPQEKFLKIKNFVRVYVPDGAIIPRSEGWVDDNFCAEYIVRHTGFFYFWKH